MRYGIGKGWLDNKGTIRGLPNWLVILIMALAALAILFIIFWVYMPGAVEKVKIWVEVIWGTIA